MEAFENKEICAKCGGICCKKSGCDCSSKDFESIKFKALLETLNSGKYSITSYCDFYPTKDGYKNIPFLYLRARNEGKGVVDLLSFKTRCANLGENGCEFSADERPSGGKKLNSQEKSRL